MPAATQAKILKEQYHIYMLSSGRMNMCGITSHNVDYVARSIRDVISESAVSLACHRLLYTQMARISEFAQT